MKRVSPPQIAIPLAGSFALLLLGSIIGLWASYDPRLSILWVLWFIIGMALYTGIVVGVQKPAHLVHIATIITLVAACGGLMLAINYRHLNFDPKFAFVTQLGHISSTPFPKLVTTHIDANAAASFLEGPLILAVGLVLATHGRWRILWGLCVCIIAYGVLLTASRGAWVALGGGTMLGVLTLLRTPAYWQRTRFWLLGLTGVGLLAIILSLIILPDAWQRAYDAVTYRAADRLILYRNSMFLALDFPLIGIGPGATFGQVYAQFQLLILHPFVGYAHNLLLNIWLSQGLPGIVGFAGLLFMSTRLVMSRLVNASDHTTHVLGWSAAVSCTVVVLHGLTDSPQYDTAWATLLISFALFGTMIAATRVADSRPLDWPRPAKPWLITAAVGFSGILIVGYPTIVGLTSANIAAVAQAKALLNPELSDIQRQELYDNAISWTERGLRIAPESILLQKRRGSLALQQDDFTTAIQHLEPVHQRIPDDQATRKALGYAYIWDGQIEAGVQTLAKLDRLTEIHSELEVWPVAWEERGRPDLADQSQQAAALLVAQSGQ
ncbi:MAG: polymerase [Chloroflexi bacterium AL-W]|nr:polymerase [Chloroflexi bacterium AL-N1]NOK65524.1 polymerase [Chloroflexi bacterium AL-N10]NOK74534.1 polymerase [Chloroflexi bacterium AL-N5]NOK80557.1 polymerase [Chloroflexi bacterium AL-W]NOK88792.1 polymerase [Chloroflexi bacterium AL-N15]